MKTKKPRNVLSRGPGTKPILSHLTPDLREKGGVEPWKIVNVTDVEVTNMADAA